MAKSRPSVKEILDFGRELDSLCERYNASCYFSTSRVTAYDLSEIRKLPKSILRGQSSWFEVVFREPPLGIPELRDWSVHCSEIGDIVPDLETVFIEKLLHCTFAK